jgi:hypothetical protein
MDFESSSVGSMIIMDGGTGSNEGIGVKSNLNSTKASDYGKKIILR